MACEVECMVRGRDVLGEGALWDEREGVLWWVDILSCRLKSLRGGKVTALDVAEPIGSFALREGGGMVAAMKSGFCFLDPLSGKRETICRPEGGRPLNRLNDGRCDRAGRFWAGTMMSDPPRRPEGTLYRLDPSGRCTAMRTGVTIPNSLAWSPDGRTMYFADTPGKEILAFDYDAATGVPSNERLFAAAAGYPDGSCVDADGCLWNAEYGGGRLVRYTPRGTIDRTIALPAVNPTCCCFGGKDLDTLYVTTASQGLEDVEIEKQQAGSVFAVRPGVKGLPESRFGG